MKARPLESQFALADVVAMPWDEQVLGFPVLDLSNFRLSEGARVEQAAADLRSWLSRIDAGMVSCRLSEASLKEGWALEAAGFRFIEMMISPVCTRLAQVALRNPKINIRLADASDLDRLIAIASTAFGNERFHQDPRIDNKAAHQRYANWVEDSLSHATQKLYCVTYDEMIVALFVTENREPNAVYWHLTALDPTRAGVGLGEQVWRAMLDYHASMGATEVKTKIAVRNTVVMNLYAKLGFRFEHPEMTFHWMRSGEMC